MPIRPVRVAHRGASRQAPENTLAALRRALEIGVDAIEVDARVTTDGVPVLLHDATLDRTTNGSGPVQAVDFEAVLQLDAGSWKGEAFAGERVPALEEALQLVRGRAVLQIEVKQPTPVEPVLQAVQRSGAAGWCVLASFDRELVRAVRELVPRLPAALISGGGSQSEDAAQTALAWAGEVAELGASCLSVNWQAVPGPEAVEILQRRGLSLWCWTVNDPDAMRRLIEWGVDGILTDDPEMLNGVLNG